MPEPVPHTIAIVDDDPDTLLLAAAALAAAGHRTITDDGRPGIGSRLALATPDLILLDLHLHDRDGEDALHEIRAEQRLALTPVYALTAALPGDPALARIQHRVAGLIAKPIDPANFATSIQRALGQAEPAPPQPEPETDAAESFQALRRRFLAGLADRATRIQEAAATQDTHALTNEIHRLRGAAGAWDLHDLAAEAANAERLLRRNDDDAAPAIARLLAAIHQFQDPK